MREALYWIWLQQVVGIGSRKADVLWAAGISPRAFYEMPKGERKALRFFTAKELEVVEKTDLRYSEVQLEKAEKLGCIVLTPDHPHFPETLLHIDGIPCVLYGKGDISALNNALMFTIVGTRKFTRYGYMSAYCLARDLAAVGCTVVSGMAHGNDYAAHVGALSVGGKTVGILACGFDVPYPAAHDTLRKYIMDHRGMILTEFPFGSRPAPYAFSVRNRLLSGIGKGVVVTQASRKSGSLITAGYAVEQNKDVFAVPGNVFDQTMEGCNRLIRDGAKMVCNALSILAEYKSALPEDMTDEKVVQIIEAAQKNSRPMRMSSPPMPVVSSAEASPCGSSEGVFSRSSDMACSKMLVIQPDVFAIHDDDGFDVSMNVTAKGVIDQKQMLAEKESVSEKREAVRPISDFPMLTAAALKVKQERREKSIVMDPDSTSQKQEGVATDQKEQPKTLTELDTLDLSAEAKKAYGYLSDQAVDVSFLTTESGMSVQEVLRGMTELEVHDLVRALPGKRYIRI